MAESILATISRFEAVGISIQELTGKMFIAHMLNKFHKENNCDYFCDSSRQWIWEVIHATLLGDAEKNRFQIYQQEIITTFELFCAV